MLIDVCRLGVRRHGYDGAGNGACAKRRGLPVKLILRLNKEVAAILVNPQVRQRITTIGAQPVGKSPAEFEAMLKADYDATTKLVAQIGLKVD
jgi:tripartite-type tricarboxylate transporter receptor subunit TctC